MPIDVVAAPVAETHAAEADGRDWKAARSGSSQVNRVELLQLGDRAVS